MCSENRVYNYEWNFFDLQFTTYKSIRIGRLKKNVINIRRGGF